MIIDFRLRPPFKSYLGLHLFATGGSGDPRFLSPFTCEPAPSKVHGSIDMFMQEMDEAGVTKGVIMGRMGGPAYGAVSNDDIYELYNMYPDRFYMFGGVNLNDVPAALDEIDRVVELGFKGVAVEGGWNEPPMYPDDKRIYPIYEKCQKLDIIVSLTASLYLGPDLSYIDPIRVQHIASDFSKLIIVIPHGGWPYAMEYVALGMMYNNLWFAPDFYVYLPGIPGANLYVEAANSYLANRFLYASSYPSRPLKLTVENFTSLDFRPDVLEKAMWKNAHWLLEERKKK